MSHRNIAVGLRFLLAVPFIGVTSAASAAGTCCRVNSVHAELSCEGITPYGAARCNAVWSGGIPGAGPCQWNARDECLEIVIQRECCVRDKRIYPSYDCGYWTSYGNPVGKNRCNAAYSFGVAGSGPCKWISGRRCGRDEESDE